MFKLTRSRVTVVESVYHQHVDGHVTSCDTRYEAEVSGDTEPMVRRSSCGPEPSLLACVQSVSYVCLRNESRSEPLLILFGGVPTLVVPPGRSQRFTPLYPGSVEVKSATNQPSQYLAYIFPG